VEEEIAQREDRSNYASEEDNMQSIVVESNCCIKKIGPISS